MKVRIVQIGNSKGIRIPKPLLEQSGLGEAVGQEVDIEAGPMRLIIRPVARAREGWDEAFKAMAESDDGSLLDSIPTQWDEEEWQW